MAQQPKPIRLGVNAKAERMSQTWNVTTIMNLCGVSRLTVYKWIRDGKLVAAKNPITGRWEVTAEALASFRRPRRGHPRPTPDASTLTLQDVASVYGVPIWEVRRWVRYGHLPAYQLKPHGRWHVRQRELGTLEQHVTGLEPLPSQYLDYERTTPEGEA